MDTVYKIGLDLGLFFQIRDDIIFATNNQTNIPKSSLRVTDAIHLQIEMYCKTRGLYYDRRKNYGSRAKNIK